MEMKTILYTATDVCAEFLLGKHNQLRKLSCFYKAAERLASG